MTVEVEAGKTQRTEAMVQEAYNNKEYILDAEYFTGMEFATQEKEMDARSRKQKHRGQER